MNVIHLDGFETGSSPELPTVLRYDPTGSAFVASPGVGRIGGSALRFNVNGSSGTLNVPIFPTLAGNPIEWVVGLAVRFLAPAELPLIHFRRAGGSQVALWLVPLTATTAALDVRRGSTVLGQTDPLGSEVWYYVEAILRTADTAGTFEVRVDQATILKVSGDTRNSGSAGVDEIQIQVGTTSSSGYVDLDDVYVATPESGEENTPAGELTTQALAPIGDGSVVQFTAQPQSDPLSDAITEVDQDGDTSYLQNDAVPQTHRTVAEALDRDRISGYVEAVNHLWVRKAIDALGTGYAEQALDSRSGTLDEQTAEPSLTSTTYDERALARPRAPDGRRWEVADLQGAVEFGWRVTS